MNIDHERAYWAALATEGNVADPPIEDDTLPAWFDGYEIPISWHDDYDREFGVILTPEDIPGDPPY